MKTAHTHSRTRFLVLIVLFVQTTALLFAPLEANAATKKKKLKAASSAPVKSSKVPSELESSPECRAKLVVDAGSGTVLFESNAHEPLAPASMIKIMTAYVTLKQARDGHTKLTDTVTVSGHASKIGGSQVYLREGEQFSLSDLIGALLIQSANDAAVAIAEHVAGSKEGFVALMNEEAKALGMKESTFYSPHGLPPGKDQQADRVSASDFTLLARALIREFPDILQVTKSVDTGFRAGEFQMSNHNHLLKSFPGCDGLKTGYYTKAGFSIAATAERNGQRLIAVVMGCADRKKRDSETARLLGEGFAQFQKVTLMKQGEPVEEAVEIAKGEKPQVVPVAAADVVVSLPGGDDGTITKKLQLCSGLSAPVAANTPCGALLFFSGERQVAKVDLLIPVEVQKAGIVSGIRGRLGW